MENDEDLNCCFERDNNWFRYRAAAIIIEDDCVLVAGNDFNAYYYSVGGAVHLGETAEEAVLREVLEETGIAYEIDRLLVIHENLFEGKDGVIEGKHCHEIAFYFLMKSKGNKNLNTNSTCIYGKEDMTWIPIKDLHNHFVYPTFLQEVLSDIPQTVKHIVLREQ